MSHNVTVTGSGIKDIEVLRRAINELASEGVRASLEQSTTFRGWMGRVENAPYVIKLPGEPYDIGLVQTEAGGEWQLRAESGFAPTCLRPPRDALLCDEATAPSRGSTAGMIGLLMQRYQLLTAEDAAIQAGYITSREFDKTTAQVHLTIRSA